MTTQDNTPSQESTSRPLPGPAGVRPIWDGQKETTPPGANIPGSELLGPSKLRWSSERAFATKVNTKRIVGLDAARGLALFGMIAIHILPAYSPFTGRPTIIFDLFAGNAAALFALLAGISVALMTGANNPHKGRRLRRSRVSLAIRALIILLLGLALGEMRLRVYNILPYYGLMFLLAIFFTGMRIRSLLIWGGAFVILGPLAVYLVNSNMEYTVPTNPDFTSLFTMPQDTLITLVVGGIYPVVTWMAYICVGLALGRMNLRWLLTQARLILFGLLLLAASTFISTFLIDQLGGFENLYLYTDGYDEEDIIDTLDYGPDGHLPTDTLWWLAISAPHTNTPFSLLRSLGVALLLLGVMLIVSRAMSNVLTPLIAAGSMSLTMYVTHLILFVAFGDQIRANPVWWFVGQIIVLFLLATFWKAAFGRGPLERVISDVCRWSSRKLVPTNVDGQQVDAESAADSQPTATIETESAPPSEEGRSNNVDKDKEVEVQ